MKKYYSLFILIFYLINNIILINLMIKGTLYQLLMIIMTIINMIIIYIFRKNIKYKKQVTIIYFLTLLYSKNIYQCLFNLSNILILIIIGLKEKENIKLSVIIIILLLVSTFPTILFILALSFDHNEMNDIYNDTHYYCENNYEAYIYSAGAMDKFHYSIGKHYDILNIDDIIEISYNERNETTENKYEKFINNHNCYLVGEKNEP